MQFRIYTERTNENDIARIVSKHFNGFTLIPATGFWKGISEPRLIIEIDAAESPYSRAQVREIAEHIQQLNNQECVLITEAETRSYLVSAPSFEHKRVRALSAEPEEYKPNPLLSGNDQDIANEERECRI
jgi:hypothetical protein